MSVINYKYSYSAQQRNGPHSIMSIPLFFTITVFSRSFTLSSSAFSRIIGKNHYMLRLHIKTFIKHILKKTLYVLWLHIKITIVYFLMPAKKQRLIVFLFTGLFWPGFLNWSEIMDINGIYL